MNNEDNKKIQMNRQATRNAKVPGNLDERKLTRIIISKKIEECYKNFKHQRLIIYTQKPRPVMASLSLTIGNYLG